MHREDLIMENEIQVRCPECGSSQIAPVRKNYDMGCGCLGLLLFGWIGLLLGLLGAGDVEMVCANCGARWEPGRHNENSSGCLASLLLILVILFLLFWTFQLIGGEPSGTTSYRNAQGAFSGSATVNASGKTYRDAAGRVTGRAVTSGNTTTYRDAAGRVTGHATRSGNATTYRDAAGRVTGRATTNGNVTTYRDAAGRVTGTATRTGGRIIYRDAAGRTAGSGTFR